jgi:glucose/arabinose dehydrogenase
MRAQRYKTRRGAVAAALIAAIAITAVLVAQSLAAPSEGDKKPAKPLLKQFDVVTLASGFRKPTSVGFLPDGTMLVSQKAGRVYSVTPDGVKHQLLDLSKKIPNGRERGMGDLAVAHDFATSRRVYLSYTYLANPDKPDGPQAMRITYITLNPDDASVANPGNPETVVLGKDANRPCPPVSNKLDCPPSINTTHQGGKVISAADGTLWVSWGESNVPSNPGKQTFRAYNPDSTAGKILHVDSHGNGLPGHPFCPKDRDLTHTCTKIYARGFRNPFRFTLTPTGHPLVSDVGWNSREEIDNVMPGHNYGWPCYEGNIKTPFYRDMGACHGIYRRAGKLKISKPLYSYKHAVGGAGSAVIVGPHYPGGAYPPLFTGSFFFGDYAEGFIKLMTLTKKGKVKIRPVAVGVVPVDLELGPDGNLVFVDYLDGTIRELVYSPANKAPQPQISATPSSGPSPLHVDFSAAGSKDPDGDPLIYDWDFGDGSPHSNAAAPSHDYLADGSYTARLKLSDGKGGSATVTRVITVGNTAPTAQVLEPNAKTFSIDGAAVTLRATGTDAEDGPLPSSAFDWDVDLIHKDHTHPLGEFIGDTAHFTAVRDHDADSHYEVTLTVTDSQGLSTTLPVVSVPPSVQPLRIGSKPKGVELSYGGRQVKGGQTIKASIGFLANLSAPETITRGGVKYHFVKWTQGGRRVQIYAIPPHFSIVRAIYKK